MAAAPVAAAESAKQAHFEVGAEDGFGILEVVIAMVILAVALMALASVFTASALSLHRSSERGTAVAIGESQMEIYRTVSYSGIRLNSSLIPTSGSYVTGHSSSSTIPSSTGQALSGQYGNDACPSTALAAACYPVQNITGPDGQSYTVDTYVDYADPSTLAIVTPAAGLTLKLVTVVVRDGKTGAVLANDSSAFHSS